MVLRWFEMVLRWFETVWDGIFGNPHCFRAETLTDDYFLSLGISYGFPVVVGTAGSRIRASWDRWDGFEIVWDGFPIFIGKTSRIESKNKKEVNVFIFFYEIYLIGLITTVSIWGWFSCSDTRSNSSHYSSHHLGISVPTSKFFSKMLKITKYP